MLRMRWVGGGDVGDATVAAELDAWGVDVAGLEGDDERVVC